MKNRNFNWNLDLNSRVLSYQKFEKICLRDPESAFLESLKSCTSEKVCARCTHLATIPVRSERRLR